MAVSGDSGDDLRNKLDYCECVRRDSVLYERLSWLEHRRWNAFLRAQGFRRPPHLEERLTDLVQGLCEDADGDALKPYAYKNVPARLHPDLVESVSGVRAEPRDLLDLASDMRRLVDVKTGKKPEVWTDSGSRRGLRVPAGYRSFDRGISAGVGLERSAEALSSDRRLCRRPLSWPLLC